MRTPILLSLLFAACHSGTAGNEHPDASNNATADAARGTADSGGSPADAGPPQKLYVGDSSAILVFDLPLTSTSTPTVTLPEDSMNSLCAKNGTLYAVVTASGGNFRVDAFAEPLTATSTPLFSLPTTFASRECKLDAAGNLFVVANQSTTQGVDVFPAPVTSSSTVSTNLTAANLNAPYGIAMDSSGDLFTAGTTITEFGPFASGNPVLASFGADPKNVGLTIGPGGNLFVTDGMGIDVYTPSQFQNGTTTPDHTLAMTVNTAYLDFDAAQNMYLTAQDSSFTNNYLLVLPKPYTGSPTVMLTLPDWGSGVMVGP
jgi:hypothetical protein